VLRTLAHRTGGNGYGSWPTPKVAAGDYSYSRGDHDKPVLNMGGAVKSFHWPTPSANLYGESPEVEQARRERLKERGINGNGAGDTLGFAGAAWATPTGSDGTGGESQRVDGGLSLKEQTKDWATPGSRDHKDTSGMSATGINPDGSTRERDDQLGRQSCRFGMMPSPSGEPTARSDSSPPTPRRAGLNPRFGLWLMGYPIGWLSCVPWGTPSSRRARSKSSAASRRPTETESPRFSRTKRQKTSRERR
jgi:hypothetical protein